VGQGILFTAPHNVNRPAKLRANNWQDVTRILREAQAAHVAAR
jgi:5'(3')-deoxyribonucleotidase